MLPTPNENIEWPKKGIRYDVTTNLGNRQKSVTFIGYSNGGVKPKYLFRTDDGRMISINPSYEIEIEESLLQDNTCTKSESEVTSAAF